MTDLVKKITAMCGLIAIVFTAFFFLETRHAPMKSHLTLENRVNVQELRRLLREAESEMYYYRDLSRKYPNDQQIKDRLREVEERVRDLKKRIQQEEVR